MIHGHLNETSAYFAGKVDLIVQREGKLRLASDKVWVDLTDWDARLRSVTTVNGGAAGLRPEAEALSRHWARVGRTSRFCCVQ